MLSTKIGNIVINTADKALKLMKLMKFIICWGIRILFVNVKLHVVHVVSVTPSDESF